MLHRLGIDKVTLASFGLVLISVYAAINFANNKVENLESLNRTNTVYNNFPYEIHAPFAQYKLPKKLIEVSGLSLAKDGKTFWSVNDQQGVMYRLDINKQKIVESRSFSSGGDFEGIELIDDTLVVLRSDGTLFVTAKGENSQTKEIPIKLHKNCDAEGLGYEKSKERILVACKNPYHKNTDLRRIYGIKQVSFKREKTPAYTISIKNLILFTLRNKVQYIKAKELRKFSPSAVAVNEQTNQIFVLSSKVNVLVVLRPDGEIDNVIPLARDLYEQPEGMTFDKKGNLFISSEGRTKRAMLYGIKKLEVSNEL